MRPHRFENLFGICLLAVLVGGSAGLPLTAGPRISSDRNTVHALHAWGKQLERVKHLLAEGKARAAYDRTERILNEMTDRIISGSSVGELLGTVIAYKAIAAGELGRTEEATWHWNVARQLFPGIARYDFSAFGDRDLFLAGQQPLTEMESEDVASLEELMEAYEGVTPPRKKVAPPPVFPKAVNRQATAPLSVVVRVIIGTEGRPREPEIVESSGELILVAAVLDQLRKWVFYPATCNDRAVPVYYQIKVNFAPRGAVPARR